MQVTLTNDWFTYDDAKDYLEVGQTYDTNTLVHHKDWLVRWEAAMHGYGLNVLVNDEFYDVRCAVASNGYGLDVLINDKDYEVRRVVAKQGYGLDILFNDENKDVRKAVDNYLKEHNYKSVFDWAKDNSVDIDFDEWLNSDEWRKRELLAMQGYSLDILVNDKNEDVRKAVADQGYGLDILVNDEYIYVRKAVYCYLKEHNYKSVFDWAKDNGIEIDLDEWLNSDEWRKRAKVARQGYGLDVLVNDKYWHVRRTVAKQGYGLDILFNDQNKDVRKAVEDYLKEHGYKSINNWAKKNPDKVHGTIDIELTESLKDFVYKVKDSNTLKAIAKYGSIEDFFNDAVIKSREPLFILTVDTKVKLIELEKNIKDNKQVYKFIANIDDGDDFIIRSIITSKDKFIQLIQSTINVLNKYPQFQKYASDLESCL